MAGFWIVMMGLFFFFILAVIVLTIYIFITTILIYSIFYLRTFIKLKAKDNDLRERILELKAKNL